MERIRGLESLQVVSAERVMVLRLMMLPQCLYEEHYRQMPPEFRALAYAALAYATTVNFETGRLPPR